VEAMACGTPLVAADRGSVAEHVRRSQGGALFEAGRPGSLADQLLSAITGSLSEAGAKARAFVQAHHSWQMAFDRIFATYDTLVHQ